MIMERGTVSIIGALELNPDVLTELQIPVGLDKDLLVNNLILESAELELYYTNFEFLQKAIGYWSSKMLPVWTKLYETTKIKYDPLKSFDMDESGSESTSINRNYNNSHTATDSITTETTNSETTNRSGTSDESNSLTIKDTDASTYSVAAFDSSKLEPQSSDAGSTNSTNTGTIGVNTSSEKTVSGTGGETTTKSNTITEENSESSNSESSNNKHTFGNIGALSSQELIKLEREVTDYNIYDIIITDFQNEFCLLVY